MDDNEKKKNYDAIGVNQPKHDTYSFTISGGEQLKPVDNGDNEKIMDVPGLPLGGVVVYPYALSPLMLNDDKSIRTIESAVSDERFVAFFPEFPDPVYMKEDGIDLAVKPVPLMDKQVSSIGVLVRIVKMLKFPDGTMRVLVRGLSRVRFLGVQSRVPVTTVRTERIDTPPDTSIETMAMVRNAVKQFQEIISFSPTFPEELKIAITNLTDNSRIVDLIADTLNITYPEKLAILTIEDLQERLHLLTILLNREVEVLRLGSEIQSQVQVRKLHIMFQVRELPRQEPVPMIQCLMKQQIIRNM